jgi:ketosteroid isomerase-like protein
VSEESTTPDLEEAVRRGLAAGDQRDLDTFMALFAPDAIWDASPVGMRVVEGREAIRRTFEDWWQAFEEDERELEEFHDLGNGVTFGVHNRRARPKGSSGFLEQRFAIVTTLADGLVRRATLYTDIDAARADAERLARERG